jgi:hypothetical protein
MRRSGRLDLLSETMPDDTKIAKFRRLPEVHLLTARVFDAVAALLQERKLLLTTGTVADAGIVGVFRATKSAAPTGDPKKRRTKQGNHRCFGMRMHVGGD